MRNAKCVIKNFVLLFAFSLLLCGCGNKIQSVPPLPGTLPQILTSEQIDTDIYFDATVSMKGFTTLAAGNVYLTLPDLLGDLCGSMGETKFFSFGAQIHALDRTNYRRLTAPEVYTEPITAVANVVDRADTNHLSIIVTDLFESESDWSNVAQKLRDKFFANHLAVAVVGIRNSFRGEIFDVGLNAAKFTYNSYDNPDRYRPFYLLILGRDDAVKNFLRKFNERQTLPNDTGYLLLSENLTETPGDFSNFKLGDVENFYSDDTLGLDERVKEFGADNFSEAASFMFSWQYQPPLGACPLDLSEIDSSIEIFSADGEEWMPLEKNDVRVNLLKDERQAGIFLVKVSLTPEKSLAEGKLNFVRIKIMPTERGCRLPAWVELWSVNVDGAAKNFDGSKTLNLTRVLGSLKDSIFAASRPALMEINFVVTP
ncbi:MAG: hypothetical protein IJL12_05735 [Selenomonadaceae bacterium]|nr:hypothetical protein [Selenomonadaceae bacterium]MBQ6131823.1 hypothetical protein [Selenomonadaceae bacterium]